MEDIDSLTLVDLRPARPDARQLTPGGAGPDPELLTRHLREQGVDAKASLLSNLMTLTPRRAWVDGTPRGYLNMIDGRWDVWGEANRADWFNSYGPGGTVEVWFQALPPGKLWLAILEVQAWWAPAGGPPQFWVGSSDTGPQFVSATFQRQYLGVIFVDQGVVGSSLVALRPLNLGAFAFYAATLVDVLG
ncbi:MAG TPA: hypothetical protein VFY84_07800 [Jiangellales bacterium]|nr:hypothetical protein [Jiangellales bacterium]